MQLLITFKRLVFDSTVFFDQFIISALLVIAFCLIWILWSKRPENSPPGSNGLPLLGNILALRDKPERVLAQWSKKYGDVCMMKMGFANVVVLGSYKAVFEAFAKSGSFANRPSTVELFADGLGLLLVDANDFHKVQRKFTLNTLRELGMGKRSFGNKLTATTRSLCSKIEAMCVEAGHKSKPFAFDPIIYENVASVISQMIFGFDLPQENPEFRKLLLKMIEPNKYNALSGILMFAPSLKYFPGFLKIASMAKVFQKNMHGFIQREIDKHVETFHLSRMRDFIDRFLEKAMGKQMHTPSRRSRRRSSRQQSPSLRQRKLSTRRDSDSNNNMFKSRTPRRPSTPKYGNFLTVPETRTRRKQTPVKPSLAPHVTRRLSSSNKTPHYSFSVDQLVSLVRDLFVAAVDTTSSTISWIVFFMCYYPKVQEKMAEEIEGVFGQDRILTMSSKEKLPYVLAVIQETFRMRPPVPLALPHSCAYDSTLMGYRIPKGAIILGNIWAVHFDQDRWPNPHAFAPERHLRDGKFIKSPHVIPFSIGTRHCVGQQLANMELFFCVVGLLQRFKFNFVDGFKPDVDGKSMVVLRPQPFDIVATVR